MEIHELQEKVEKHIQKHGGHWQPLSILARMSEEVGELARAINIEYGEKKKKHDLDGSEISEELADVVVVSVAMANALGINLEKEIKDKLKKDLKRNKGVYFK